MTVYTYTVYDGAARPIQVTREQAAHVLGSLSGAMWASCMRVSGRQRVLVGWREQGPSVNVVVEAVKS